MYAGTQVRADGKRYTTGQGPASPDRSTKMSVYGTPGKTQTITRTSTGGTFKLSYNGQKTATITAAAAVTAGNIETALEALPNLVPAEVAVTGAAGGPFTVTITPTKATGSVKPLTVDGALATGGTVVVAQAVPVWNGTSKRLEIA